MSVRPTMLRFSARLLIVLAFLPARVGAQTCTPPPSGMVSWYRMEGSANDELGNNNPSATSGIGFGCSEVGQGVGFSSSGFIDIPDSPSLQLQQITLDAWAMANGPGPTPNGSVIITKNTNANDLSIALGWTEASGGRFLFSFFNAGNTSVVSTDPFPPGAFHHVAGTYDGATFQLYVDGVPEGSIPFATTISYDSGVPWVIGANNPPARDIGYERTWNGIIDEVEIFGRALSATEIADIYAAGPAGKCPSPPICTTTSTTVTTTSTSSSTSSTSSTTSTSTTTSTTLPAVCATTPQTGCHLAAALKSSVKIVDNANPAKRVFKWTWKSAPLDTTSILEFRDPVNTTPTVRACVYDASGNLQPLMQAQILPGGTCAGKPCWKVLGHVGDKYKNASATPDGLTGATLKAAGSGKTAIALTGKGALLQNPAGLNLTSPVTVQLLIGDDGTGTSCWQTTYSTGVGSATKFVAKGP